MILVLAHLRETPTGTAKYYAFKDFFAVKITPLASSQVEKTPSSAPLESVLHYMEKHAPPYQKLLIEKLHRKRSFIPQASPSHIRIVQIGTTHLRRSIYIVWFP